jgi:hypothetical protein
MNMIRVGDHAPESAIDRIHSSDGGVESRHARTCDAPAAALQWDVTQAGQPESEEIRSAGSIARKEAGVAPGPSEAFTRRAAELWAIERTQWSAAEYEALAIRYSAATTRMQVAISDRNFVALRSAYLDLAEIADQTAFLNDGLHKAIESVTNRSLTP